MSSAWGAPGGWPGARARGPLGQVLGGGWGAGGELPRGAGETGQGVGGWTKGTPKTTSGTLNQFYPQY